MTGILIIDDDPQLCRMLERAIGKMDHTTTLAHSLRQGLVLGQTCRPDIVLLDVHLPDANGIETMEQVRQLPSAPEVIIFTGAGDPDGAELAIKGGAWDYIEKSSSVKNITRTLLRALEYRAEKCTQGPVFLERKRIIGASHQIIACLDQVAQAVLSDVNVLITGETGTGKERFAEAIHINSQRANHDFVVVDCAALPTNLVESILFGHEKGAFTGADQSRSGLIKQAHGGTLFLDEIGELPLDLQKALLRVLEEHCFRPLGSQQQINSDFRLVAATNRDLEAIADAGKFRRDLLFRIRALSIELPPLRERAPDIRDLAIYFNDMICEKAGIEPKHFSKDFFGSLGDYFWPGNVRELRHAMEHAISAARFEKTLFVRHLPNTIRVHLAKQGLKTASPSACTIPDEPLKLIASPLQNVRSAAIEKVEKCYLEALMPSVNGDVQKACQISGLSRSRLYHLLKRYDLRRAL